MARRRRYNDSLLDVLVTLPWYVSVGLGVVSYIGLRYVLPAAFAGNPILKGVALGLSSLSGLVAGAFVLVGIVILVRDKLRASNAPSVSANRLHKGYAPPSHKPQYDVDFDRTSVSRAEPVMGSTVPQEARKPVEWSIELIQRIEWKRFEDLCQKFYELKGIQSETTPLGPDGGIDIRLYQDDSGHATSIVQCKAWGDRYVGVKPVRELLGVMAHEKIGKAFFMASGRYSDEAKAFASSNRITLIDGQMLLMMIQRLPTDAQQKLLEFATAGDYTTPTCPTCGIKMHRVAGTKGRSDFWGCRNYPNCRQRLGMRRSGPGD